MKESNIVVLVVDDYEPWRRFVCSSLKRQLKSPVMSEATDGAEAVQKTLQIQPDLVVLDIGLPKLNGIEVARQICEVTSQPKILFLSENRSLDVVREGLNIGGSGYVVKSNAAGELWPAVQAVLRGELYLSPCLTGYEDLQLTTREFANHNEDLLTSSVEQSRDHATSDQQGYARSPAVSRLSRLLR